MPLPIVLIGPILRRVEPGAVSVFIATSKATAIRVSVFEGPVDADDPPAPIASASADTRRFAAAFHAVVVTVPMAGATALQPGKLYSYDVEVTSAGDPPRSLQALGLLADRDIDDQPPPEDPPASFQAPPKVDVVALGYGEGRLPSFVTCPAALDALVLAHASCRKAHGDGAPAMQHLDAYIEDLHGAVDGRPHMLFLTGDQIYADDVATALLPGISSLGIELLGDVETVPAPAGRGDDLLVNTTVLPAGFRQKVTGLAGFTSDWAWSHLIGFGEFLAMYCIAWNPELWPTLGVIDLQAFDETEPTPTTDRERASAERYRRKLEADVVLRPAGAPLVLGRPSPDAPDNIVSPLYAGTEIALNALRSSRREYLAGKSLLGAFRREVPKVRRVLANTPTYMSCDDHDVTDDWFMTAGIRAKTLGDGCGQALVRNALAAHTVCQAWGNEPGRWVDAGDRRDLLDAIGGLFGAGWTGGAPDGDAARRITDVLGLKPDKEPRFDFSFSVDGPAHRVRALDTRTVREYDTPKGPPGLLTAEALDRQLPLEDLPEGHVLVVISPAPVFGPPLLTEIGGAILVTKHDLFDVAWSKTERSLQADVNGLEFGTPLGQQYYDAEHWGVHPEAFERLLARLSHHRRVVVLAGDVHYGGAFAMDWTGEGRTSRIVHFTSSAARNDWKDSAGNMGPPGLVHNLFALNGFATGLQRVGLPMTRLGWSATLPPVVTDLGIEPPQTRLRVQTGPVVLSDELFRTSHALTRPPEWVWRARPIVDERPMPSRPEATQVPEPATDIPATGDGVRRYHELAGLHVRALRTQAIARGLQFLNNVGLVTFGAGDDGIETSQALLSLRSRPDPNETGAPYVVYRTSLEADPVPFPTSVGPRP